MQALVTGGCGFVGRRFVGALLRRGYQVRLIDDLSTGASIEMWPDPVRLTTRSGLDFIHADVRDFMRRENAGDYDLILHLAAVVGGRITIETDPLRVATDLAIDADFFNWTTRGQLPRKVVYFSSSAAYPIVAQSRESAVRLSEQLVDFQSGSIGVPDMTYGWAKLTGEYLAQHAAEQYGLNVVCYRPFSGYGEEQDQSYPFPSILERVARRDDPMVVWGSGRQARDFIHIEDVVNAVFASVEELPSGGVLNLGTGIETTFIDLANLACEIAGYSPEIVTDQSKPEGVFTRVADCSRMLRFYQPKIDLREGIERTLAYYEALDERKVQ